MRIQKSGHVLYVETKKQTAYGSLLYVPEPSGLDLGKHHRRGIDNDKYLYECPDFFELAVDGSAQKNAGAQRANSEYAIGSFDGKTFTPEESRLPGHQGRGFYAPQTFTIFLRRTAT